MTTGTTSPTTLRIIGFWLAAAALCYILLSGWVLHDSSKPNKALVVSTFILLIASGLLLPGLLLSVLVLPRMLRADKLVVRWLRLILLLGASAGLGSQLAHVLGIKDEFAVHPWPWMVGYIGCGLLAAAWRFRPWLGQAR